MALTCLAGSLSVAAASTAPRYSVTPLPDSQTRRITPLAISSNGKIVGRIQVGGGAIDHGFVWDGKGSPLPIPALVPLEDQDSTRAEATGVNASGTVVGWSEIDGEGATQAFVSHVTSGQGDRDLLRLSALGDVESQAWGINNAGTIVGAFGAPPSQHAFVLLGENKVIDLGPGVARGISQNGYVVGQTFDLAGNRVPFLFRDADNDGQNDPGELITLGTLGAVVGNEGYAVNDSGTVVGTAQGQDGLPHAAIWRGGQGAPQQGELPLLINNDPVPSEATGINNAGSVVGTIGSNAFLYEKGQWLNLDSYVPKAQNSNLPSWTFYSASAINSGGQIVADGVAKGTSVVRGCLLSLGNTPPPPPASTVKIKSLTVTPGQFTLRNLETTVTTILTISGKPTKSNPAKIVLSLQRDDFEPIEFRVTLTSPPPNNQLKWVQKISKQGTAQIQPGTYEIVASIGEDSTRRVNLVIDPPTPLTLTDMSLGPLKGGKPNRATPKVKAGSTLTGRVVMSDLPDVPPAKVKIALMAKDGVTPVETLVPGDGPLGFVAAPVEMDLDVDAVVEGFSFKIPAVLMPGIVGPQAEYVLRASYNGVSQLRRVIVLKPQPPKKPK